MVVTLTGGERGDFLNPAMDLPEVRSRIRDPDRRDSQGRRDPQASSTPWLGFVDSGHPRATRPAAAGVRRVALERPTGHWSDTEFATC
jgi:mycothiol S-conjugate amidase